MTIHTTDPLFDSLQHLLSDFTDPKDVTREANLKTDLGLDSLDIAEMSWAIEDVFDVTVDDDSLAKFQTVADVLAYVTANLPD